MPDAVPGPADPLAELRRQIDAIDEQLVKLLNDRARVVVEVGRLKHATGGAIYAPDREKRVLERVRSLNDGPLPHSAMEAIWRELMSGSFALEKPLRIAYAGPAGNFSHAAAVRKFGSSVEYVPVGDVGTVFQGVARGHADYGLVPMEDSLHGGLAETLDAFWTASARICAEVLIQLHLHLLAPCPWEDVKTIFASPEALARCRRWLGQAAGGRQVIPVADPFSAQLNVAASRDSAILSPRSSAESPGLRLLFQSIEDNTDGVSRFFVIGRDAARRTADDKTAVMFTTAHRPGALADVLDVFKERGINLTDIEKRPSPGAKWEYYFFIDTQGHLDDPSMTAAIDAARKHCLQLTILGSYPRAAEML
jgi:chorismate mutase/prephenate dehydratase